MYKIIENKVANAYKNYLLDNSNDYSLVIKEYSSEILTNLKIKAKKNE